MFAIHCCINIGLFTSADAKRLCKKLVDHHDQTDAINASRRRNISELGRKKRGGRTQQSNPSRAQAALDN
jgi:hypothetical protein